jgi:hypothetical protein
MRAYHLYQRLQFPLLPFARVCRRLSIHKFEWHNSSICSCSQPAAIARPSHGHQRATDSGGKRDFYETRRALRTSVEDTHVVVGEGVRSIGPRSRQEVKSMSSFGT